MLWLIPACAALIAAALLIYKHLVTDRITDGGDMENPFLKDREMLEALPDGCRLHSLHWSQNGMSFDACYSFYLTGGPDEAVMECSFSDPGADKSDRLEAGGYDEETGAERKALPVSPERWEQTERLLKSTVLPRYESPDPGLSDAEVNTLSIERIRSDGSTDTVMLDGSTANELYALLADIAREAAEQENTNAAQGRQN